MNQLNLNHPGSQDPLGGPRSAPFGRGNSESLQTKFPCRLNKIKKSSTTAKHLRAGEFPVCCELQNLNAGA
jgi:hypothetical protein